MSDIKKELRLIATLDDTAFKRQIQGLKKELGQGFSLKGSDLNEFRSAFKGIAKDFGDQIRAVLNEVKQAKGTAKGSSGTLPKGATLGAKDIQINAREVHITATNVRFSGTQMPGAGGPTGAPAPAGDGGGGPTKFTPGGLGGQFPGAARFLGAVGTIGSLGGLIQGGTSSVNSIRRAMAEREFRSTMDQVEGKYVEDIARQSGRDEISLNSVGGAIGGGFLGGAKGLLGGAAAGAGIGTLIAPGVGTVVGGAIGGAVGGIGGLITGGISGYQEGSNQQGELRVDQIKPLLRAVNEAQRLNPMRLQTMAGGGVTSDILTDQMKVGAGAFGYKPEETLNQFLTARQILGNQGASQALGNLQSNQRFLGIDVGTGAENIETMAGAAGGTRSAAISKQIETIKKGVAAGLDVSKSGAFLKTVSQAVSEGGLGRVDTDLVTSKLAGLTKGIAGGEDVTDTTLNQARAMFEMLSKEATSESGIAGLGNIANVQDVFKGKTLSPEMMLQLTQMGPNAKPEDYLKVLSEDPNSKLENWDLPTMTKQLSSRDNMRTGLEALGVNKGFGRTLAARERGIRTEEQIRMEEAQAAGISPEDLAKAGSTIGGVAEATRKSQEYKLTQVEAVRDSKIAEKGLDLFGVATNRAVDGLVKLREQLDVTAERFARMADNLEVSGSKR